MSKQNESVLNIKDSASVSSKIATNTGALSVLVLVFFFWGFIAASNSILIPYCKEHFKLTQFQSQLIGSAFYGAYFAGALVVFVISNILKKDILNIIGYKKGIIYGLLISVIGALLIIPSTNANSFNAILISQFIIALGFSLQQTCAQPFAISLGDPSTGAHRLNLGGGINSFGTTIGPLIISMFLFGSISNPTESSVSNINNLYLIVAAFFTLVAIIFAVSKLPDGKNNEAFEQSKKASGILLLITGIIVAASLLGQFTSVPSYILMIAIIVLLLIILFQANAQAKKNDTGWGAMKYPQVIYGMIAIFVYVGVEVTIDNNLGALLKQPGYFNATGLKENESSLFISLYWGSLMIGRWTGALSVFNLSKNTKMIAGVIVPFIAFGVILGVNHLKGNDISSLYAYSAWIVVAIIALFIGQDKPFKTLLVLCIMATIAMLIGVFTTGKMSVYAFVSGGLCCSVMWPCIFTLAIGGVGKYTGQASALLIMMILGAAIIPPLQGAIGDTSLGLHQSYLIAAACFLSLAFIAFKLKNILQAQGLDFDKQVENSSH